MISKRVSLIRLTVLIIMILATFALSWYMFSRFLEMTQKGMQDMRNAEVNHPRLNKSLLEEITIEFDRRKLYTSGDSVYTYIKEPDPFYE